MKKLLLLLAVTTQMLFSQNLNRQIKVELFEEDQSGIINPEKDKALIIVRSQIPDLSFDANRNLDVKPQSGSVWNIYCSPGTIRLKVSASGYEQLEIPPKSVIGGRTFNLRLVASGFAPNISENLFEVVFSLNQTEVYASYGSYSPVLSRSQTISYKLPKGEYTFTFQKNGFKEVKQTVSVDKNLQLPITMESGGRTTTKFLLPGLIVIESDPSGAEVLVDGQKIGVTPYQGDLTAGTHQLEVRKPLYYPSVSRFTLSEGESQTIPVTLKPRFGFIQFASAPSGAKITLDGKLIGITPIAKQQIESSTHKIKIEAELYHTYEEEFKIVDGQEKIVNAVLKPAFGALVVNSLPESSATIFIDGKQVGTTPFANKKLASGKYFIKITKPFYADVEEEIIIEDEKTTTKTMVMPQNFGTLTIAAPESKIFINGKLSASNNFYARMNPGKYSLRAERSEKYIPAEKDVFISVGGSELVKLEPEPRLGSASIFVEPTDARNAELFIEGKSYGAAPKVLSLLIGDYTITAKKSGFLDLSQKITIKEREAAKINMQMFTYEGSLQAKRDSWGMYKWISAAVAVSAGAAAMYFDSKANSYYDEYQKAITVDIANSKRDRVNESKLYNNISLGAAITAGVSFLVTWVVQSGIE